MTISRLFRKLLAKISLLLCQAAGSTRFWEIFRDLRRNAFLPHDLRMPYRKKILAELLRRGRETEFLNDRFQECGITEIDYQQGDVFAILRRLHPIHKTDIAIRFPRGVLTNDPSDNRRIKASSGTTGERLSVVTNFSKRDFSRASMMYLMDLATTQAYGIALVDIPPNGCNSICGLEGRVAQGWWELFENGVKKREVFKATFRRDLNGLIARRIFLRQDILPPLDARAPNELLDQLESTWRSLVILKPELLRGFPQYLLWLAQFAQKFDIPSFGLKFVMPYGGLASRSLFDQVRESLGVEVRNSYGTSELGPIAASCDNQHAMHVNEQLFEVEIMRDGRPVEDGEIGEIVITDFANTAMPMIRYKVGDVGRIVCWGCGCGRTTRRIEVLGRVQETIQLENRWITPAAIGEIAYSDRGVSNIRVDEIGVNQFELQIAASINGHPPNVEVLKKQFSELFDRSIRVSHRIVPYIQPEPNGKFLTCRLRSSRRMG